MWLFDLEVAAANLEFYFYLTHENTNIFPCHGKFGSSDTAYVPVSDSIVQAGVLKDIFSIQISRVADQEFHCFELPR